MRDPVETFIEVARRIQRAGSVVVIAQAIVQAVPGCDQPTGPAVEGCLRALELSLAQRTTASIELAADLRLDTRRKLTRLLGAHAEPELCAGLADLGVQAVAALAGPLTTASAVGKTGSEPAVFAGLTGAMFVSSRARQYALEYGMDSTRLDALLARAAAPIRKACAASDVTSVGELRFSASANGITAAAHLDTSSDGRPVICIRLYAQDQAPPLGAADPRPTDYRARLLRRMVS